MMDLLYWATVRTAILITGVGIGAYEAHQIEVVPLVKIAVAGACAQPGIQTVSVSLISWYNCQDAPIVAGIQRQAAEQEAEAVLADMARNQPKGKRK